MMSRIALLLFSATFFSTSPLAANPCTGKKEMAYLSHKGAAPVAIEKLESAFQQLKKGDHLWICEGAYRFQQGIELNNLEQVTIEGDNASIVTDVDAPVLSLQRVTRVTLKGLHLVHDLGQWCSHNTLEIYDSAYVTVADSNLDGSGYFGVAINISQETTLTDNLIHNAEYGVATWNSKATTLKNNELRDNTYNFLNFTSEAIAELKQTNTIAEEGKRKRPQPIARKQVQPNFDCAKASNKTEKTICQVPQLGLLDQRLGKLYSIHLDQSTTATFSQIRQEQRHWLKLRNGCGGDRLCIEKLYQTRINALIDVLPE